MTTPPWPWHAGGVSGADDVDVEMLRQLTGIEVVLSALPAPQVPAGGELKQAWFGDSLQDAPDTRQPSSVARAGACSACRVVAPLAAVCALC